MKVVPISHTSNRTFPSNLTALAACAKRSVAATDGGTKVTSGKHFTNFSQSLQQMQKLSDGLYLNHHRFFGSVPEQADSACPGLEQTHHGLKNPAM